MKSLLFGAIVFLVAVFPSHAQMFEDMETGTKNSYAPASVTLSTGSWFFHDALLGRDANDRKNGSQSARIRDGYIQMNFNYPNGLNEVSFYAANAGFSGDTGGIVQVSYSTNNGSTWTPLGDPITLTNELEQYTISGGIQGNVRLRFARTAGNRINVDDVLITDYFESEDEPTIQVAIGAATVNNGHTYVFDQTAAGSERTFNMTIRNLGNETLNISSAFADGFGFSATQPTSTSLDFNETAQMTVTFAPEFAGQYEGMVQINSNAVNHPVFNINLEGEAYDASEIITIAQARSMPLGSTVTVAGIVTVADQFRGPVYFQDSTGGIAWYNDVSMRQQWLINAVIGDSVIVTGPLGQFNELLQIINEDSYQVFPEGNREIEPLEITLSQMNSGNYEAQLITIKDVTFTNTGSFNGGTNYNVSDGSGSGQMRVDNFTNIPGMPIPNLETNLTGIAGRFLATRQIIPRFRQDIRPLDPGPVIVSAPPFETAATSSSITFQWETEQAGHSEIRYGLTPSLELGSVFTQAPTTQHSITVDNLEPATTYKIQVRSAVDADTSFSNVQIVTTGSPAGSSGQILVFFNKDVDHSLATYQEAAQNVDFKDTLIERIDAAEESAVFAFYSISGSVGTEISNAIFAAHQRGVDVRVIASGHSGQNQIITNLANAGVRAVVSTGQEQHHNKFAIFDATHPDPSKAWVVTSSWNATDLGTYNQFQNMVKVQDVALARAYVREFNQMWGGSGGNFNPSNAKFSENKVVVNPTAFWVGDDETQILLYFSPQGGTETAINRALSSAEATIDLGLNLITRRPISNTMLGRFNDGVKVRGVIGEITGQGSEWEYLSGWADVHHFSTAQFGLLHHKYAIIDGEDGGLDSKVITGSHNWSANANTRNDENTLIIYNSRVANEFFQEYGKRYHQAGGQDVFNPTTNVEEDFGQVPARATLHQNYPNPFNPTTNIRFELPGDQQVSLRVYDITGRLVSTLLSNQMMGAGTHTVTFDASRLASGVYIYRMQLSGGQAFSRTMTLIK